MKKSIKVRKKPVVVDAIRWTGKNVNAVLHFVGLQARLSEPGKIVIKTLEGAMTADKGDWVIRGVNGEHYPCKPGIFKKTYDKVEEDAAEDSAPAPKRRPREGKACPSKR